MASRASEKMNKHPCSSRCWPSGHAAGKRPLLHGIFFLTLRGYINRRPCPRVRPRGHTTQRYSSCYYCVNVMATPKTATSERKILNTCHISDSSWQSRLGSLIPTLEQTIRVESSESQLIQPHTSTDGLGDGRGGETRIRFGYYYCIMA